MRTEPTLLNELSYSLIAVNLRKLLGNDFLYLDDPIQVNNYYVWGLSASPSKEIFVMDYQQEWAKVEPNETGVIAALFPRVEALKNQFALSA